MSTVQKVYREVRSYLTREEARYFAPRFVKFYLDGGASPGRYA